MGSSQGGGGRVHTGNYRFTHGKNPRGNGNWSFSFAAKQGGRNGVMNFAKRGMFSKVAKAALKEARRHGEYSVEVDT